MTTDTPHLSDGFQRLYCDANVFGSFSVFHPISFAGVLPFQSRDLIVDDQILIQAEEAHLADRNDHTRREVIDAYVKCGMLPEVEADNVKSAIDYFGFDFFELMGMVYANAGMFICALRWYREFIAELEANPRSGLDSESVYASVGYCLYSLGLFAEAISWSKSCMGPRPMADALCRALINYEVEPSGGVIQTIERSGARTRYTISAPQPADVGQTVSRLKAAMKALPPFQEVYIDWIRHDAVGPGIKPEGYPFRAEFDAGSLLRHKMNLIFATCGQADALIEKGFHHEAKRLLSEAAMLEPEASIVLERLNALP